MTKRNQAIVPAGGKLRAFSASLASRAAVIHRQYKLDKRLRRVVRELPDQVDRPNLRALFRDWGDPLDEDGWQFVEKCVAEALVNDGPILQCGTNLMTFVLGAACHSSDSPNKHLWTLENDTQWANLVRARLTQYDLAKAHVIHTPAEIFGDFVWYDECGRSPH